MINLKQLITEGSKSVKIYFKVKESSTQNGAFSVFEYDGVFVFLPKTSKDLDKLELVEYNTLVETLLDYLKKQTSLQFDWDPTYRGAGYGFNLNLNQILNKLK